MIHSAEIYLWGKRLGYIIQKSNIDCPVFEYDKDFLTRHIEVSPFKMPLSKNSYSFPELTKIDSFKGLPGLLADSLPDRFGNAVINNWLISQGRSPESLSSIERLCYTGVRGMGALEYQPSNNLEFNREIDINEMTELASDVLSGKSKLKLSKDSAQLEQLMSIGSSAGGARAKAVLAIDEKSGSIKSGQINAGPGYDYWLLKFDGVNSSGDHGLTDPKEYTKIEYAYYLMAKDASIDMTECRLLNKDDRYHFMTKRFDRVNGKKLHMQTLAALSHCDYNTPRLMSYESYANYAMRLGLGLNDIKEIFRRMVFNVMACNCDDHVKNCSFLMDKKGIWSLSPAYDVTFAYAPGNRWISEHQMTINGKSAHISMHDLLLCGKSMRIPIECCERIIDEVKNAINNWMTFAEKAEIKEERALAIYSVIDKNQSHIFSDTQSLDISPILE